METIKERMLLWKVKVQTLVDAHHAEMIFMDEKQPLIDEWLEINATQPPNPPKTQVQGFHALRHQIQKRRPVFQPNKTPHAFIPRQIGSDGADSKTVRDDQNEL